MSTSSALEVPEGKTIFDETDRLDEDQIKEEMKGKVLKAYFYEIRDKESGRSIPGISWAGVKWLAGLRAEQKHPLSVEHVECVESADGRSYRALAYVKDLATGEKRPGAYEQSRMMRVQDRDERGGKIPNAYHEEPNPFAYTLAVSKAERNGLRHFLSEPIILAAYEQWKKGSSGGGGTPKDVTNEAKVSDVRPPPPPADLAGKPLEERLAYDLQPWLGEVQVVPGIDVVEVKMPTGMAEGPAKAIRQIMDTYSAKRSMQGNELSYTVAR